MILEEVRRDVFERPKPTIDLDYLYSVRNEIQKFSDDTNSQLKKNVYQNYSLFIDSSREIATLKDEMKQLNTLLEQQLSAMNKLLDQLNKTPIIQTTIERPEPRGDIYGALGGAESENDSEVLPEWFVKSPEDFDVLIAQRNLKEAVELAKEVKEYLLQYPKCCDNQMDLKSKVEDRVRELINVICSELQPATDRSIQGGPRSSLNSIHLLQELNLTSRAVKLYLDMRSSVLRFVLDQQKVETATTLQYIKQICSIFFHNTVETCNEFKQAFGVPDNIKKALDECAHHLDDFESPKRKNHDDSLLFEAVRPIFEIEHQKLDSKSTFLNGHDISSQILNSHGVNAVSDDALASNGPRWIFQRLSTYSSLTYWITLEFENFALLFREHVFNNTDLSLSMIAESIYYLRTQCSKMAKFCEIDMSQFIEKELRNEIRQLIEDSGRNLVETIKKLDRDEQWKPQQFENKAEKTRFIEEMNDVDLKTMPKYISDDFKILFTASKTAFARFFLIIVNDLAKLATPMNKSHVDTVLTKAFEIQMDSVIEALSKAKMTSQARFIKGNSNFLLDKVILVADERYTRITNMKCQKLVDCRSKYQAKADQVAKLQNV